MTIDGLSDLANSNYGGSKPQLGRTLAGVISGAAANLRSRLHHLSSAPDLGAGGSLVQAAAAAGDRSPSVSQGRRASEHDALAAVGIGEQSATNIPITVPGAAAYVDASRPEPFGEFEKKSLCHYHSHGKHFINVFECLCSLSPTVGLQAQGSPRGALV